MKTQKLICKRCIMDNSASNFFLDKSGCNFCNEFEKNSKHIIFESFRDKKKRLKSLVENIKRSRIKNKSKYDCIVGVSGGIDSSWCLYQAKKLGLNPLAVHMDNSWNSELAQNNISNIVKKLDVDIYTHVIEWDEYKSAMNAFFKSHVIDIELLYDNAMLKVNYDLAKKFGIKYILSGSNHSSEGMKIPSNWSWFKYDKVNIKYLCKKFENLKLRSLPTIGTIEYINYEFFKRIKWINFPDYFIYNKFEAIKDLKEKFDFKPYPYKHYESIFTRFYQGYILPKKFNVDKRKLHYSTLIVSKQLSRNKALELIKNLGTYPSEKDLDRDIRYFLKKMSWTKRQFKNYLSIKEIKHDFYKSEIKLWSYLHKTYNIYKTFKRIFI